MEIVTARLRLNGLSPGDAANLFAYRSAPAVARYQGWKPASIADAARFIEAQQGVVPDSPGTWWQRAIRLRETGELIGDLGLHFLDDATVELGISLAPAHQRRGYAREVVEVMLDFVFGGLHKQKLVALVDPRNLPCIRMLEGVGLRQTVVQADTVVLTMQSDLWLAPADEEDRR